MPEPQSARILETAPSPVGPTPVEYGHPSESVLPPVLDLTDFKRDLSELTDRLGHAQDCL